MPKSSIVSLSVLDAQRRIIHCFVETNKSFKLITFNFMRSKFSIRKLNTQFLFLFLDELNTRLTVMQNIRSRVASPISNFIVSSDHSLVTMKPIITPLYLSLFLHILTLLVAGQSPPIYSPVDDITIACGNSGQHSINFDPRTWIGDISSKYSPTEDFKRDTASQIRKAPPSSSASQPPYTTARLSYSKFTYKIPLSPGQKFVRLHFNPATYNPNFDRSNSLFSVEAGGFTLLGDFNASVTADFYGGSPLFREFCVNIETEQSLDITFIPAKDAYAFINGIEIVSMPTSLYYTSSPKLIGSETLYAIGNNTAMEMVYRINIGGSPISPNQDTGMYRNWDAADDTYLDDASRKFSVLPQNNTIELNFVTIPDYSAPKAVYETGRSMGPNKTINKSYNLTWVFPVDPKFYYLVRLHFCEFEAEIINFGDRSFQIYMANQTAEKRRADVIGWSGGNGNPVYRDYVVAMFMPPVGSRKKVDLFLVLAALQKDSYTKYNDAILNGLEIFKLSDINRNLAGPNPDSPIYIAYDGININCGFSGSRSYDNRMWIGDINSTLPIVEEQLAGSQVRNAPPASSSSSSSSLRQVPYTTARISRFEFTYRVPLTAGKKFIRLHFNPASYGEFQSSEALFFVTAGRYTLLNFFNPSLVANDETTEIVYKEFCMNIETNNILDLTFSPSRAINNAYAFINGIEIVSMPTNLYYSSATSPGVKDVGKNLTYHIENNTALEMVHRINVGGSTLSPDRDTGMYRNWYGSDDLYMDVLSRRLSVIQSNTSTQPKFDKIPKYTAPDEIYQTGRSTGTNETIYKSYNLTWAISVDPKFSYLVRLHFCEFDPAITLRGQRVFLVYIANQTAEQGADIIMWSGGNGIPIYRDYVVFMSDPGGPEKVSLFVSLQAKPKYGKTSYTDGILNGLEIFKLFDSKNSQISNNSTPMIAIVGGVLSGILVCFVLGFLVIKRPWKSKDSGLRDGTTKSTMTPGSPLPSYFCRCFSLAEIKAATKNFNDTFIIGVGGFGNVYKGCIDSEATPVAIKRLKRESSQGAYEFKTEIEILSQLRHRHLVSLIGYCADKGEMILVYDYMARGTLRDHLYHTNNPPLPWEQRLQICIGTARGLQYLHSGAKGTIIHRDVKSTNILLDDKWVAKVSDFGLSKGTNNISKTHISTVVKGSFGYLDPEYYRRQRLTEKSDVYSLGVVLFEVLCARPAVIQTEELKQVSLAEWAKSCHQNGELDQIIDPSLRGKIAAECLNKFTEVAISCIDDYGMDRPSMNDVVKGLELALQFQKSAEGNSNCTEKNVETETSSSEQSCATIDSIKCISATIFSEINNPSGR